MCEFIQGTFVNNGGISPASAAVARSFHVITIRVVVVVMVVVVVVVVVL